MSSTQQQVIVKAYYNDLVENQPEIRRFAIDISSTSDVYQALETTISQLNSDYLQGQFTLQYVDEDNDRITFSSNNELQSALNNIPLGGIIKIYVKPKVNKSEETTQNINVHFGVICDGCQGPVIGNRYKCLECHNYDLCQTCSDKKLHREHNMMKITRPCQRSFGGHRRCGRGPFNGGHRMWRHFMNQQTGGATAAFPIPPDMAACLSQFNGKELAELIQLYLPEFLRTDKINEMINQFKTGEQANKPIDQNTLLENAGKFLQEILSPFGIDCDYFVDKQKTETPSETKNKPEEATANSDTSTEPKPSAPPTNGPTSAPTGAPPLGNLLEQLQTMFQAPPPTNGSASASTSAGAPPLGNLLAQLQTMFQVPLPANGSASTSTGAPPLSNLLGQLQTMFQAPPPTTTSTVADKQAQEQKKIDECIERMIAMGFVDTNGVLVELIKSKKGDLEQVLDALNPRNYKN